MDKMVNFILCRFYLKQQVSYLINGFVMLVTERLIEQMPPLLCKWGGRRDAQGGAGPWPLVVWGQGVGVWRACLEWARCCSRQLTGTSGAHWGLGRRELGAHHSLVGAGLWLRLLGVHPLASGWGAAPRSLPVV